MRRESAGPARSGSPHSPTRNIAKRCHLPKIDGAGHDARRKVLYDVTKEGGAAVDHSHAEEIETQMLDIQGMPLSELGECDQAQLAPYLEMLQQQVQRPRHNMGSGPPGRVD